MVLFWQLPRLEHSRLKLQRNKAFPGCLRKSAPPRVLTAGYKILAAVHGVVVSQPHPKEQTPRFGSTLCYYSAGFGSKNTILIPNLL